MTVTLDDRAVIAVGGETARDFLQGLITNDMAQCAPGQPIYTALLTPQGKVLFDFLIFEAGGEFLLDCVAVSAPDLLKRLTMYRLRAKVDLAVRDDLSVAVAWDGTMEDAPADPRLARLGKRAIRGLPGMPANVASYHAHRLSCGVPDSADMPPDTAFPLDLGFEELHGVSFKKGCYIGQEVTARMKHRATARRRMLIANFDAPAPPAGTPVMASVKELGTLATGQGNRALAMIRLDRLDDAVSAGADITANGQRVTLVKPDWLSL